MPYECTHKRNGSRIRHLRAWRAFAQNSIEDGIDPSYLDRVVGMASAAQFDREALVTLCHMGMPHPAKPWDLRHMWSSLNIIGPATGSAEEHG